MLHAQVQGPLYQALVWSSVRLLAYHFDIQDEVHSAAQRLLHVLPCHRSNVPEEQEGRLRRKGTQTWCLVWPEESWHLPGAKDKWYLARQSTGREQLAATDSVLLQGHPSLSWARATSMPCLQAEGATGARLRRCSLTNAGLLCMSGGIVAGVLLCLAVLQDRAVRTGEGGPLA